ASPYVAVLRNATSAVNWVDRSMAESCAPGSPRTNESLDGRTQTALIPWPGAGPAPVARPAGDRPDRFHDGGRPLARLHPAGRVAPRRAAGGGGGYGVAGTPRPGRAADRGRAGPRRARRRDPGPAGRRRGGGRRDRGAAGRPGAAG